jgi:predicted O-methyltransferase YrrM
MDLFPVKSYLNYLLKARHYKGYGIHSPFMFELVSEVLWEKHPFYSFSLINAYRKKLLGSDKVINVTDLGAGSHKLNSKKRKVADICRSSAIRRKYGEFLFRLVSRYKSKTIVELGTSLGVSTMYLAMPGKNNKVVTIEGCPETAAIAKESFEAFGPGNIESLTGRFTDVLPGVLEKICTIDLLFVDGHHEKEATIDYFNLCKKNAGNDSIFIFDDIHWSKGMEEAWEIIHNDKDVTVSADLYQLGLVFFCKECKKQHYVIRF